MERERRGSYAVHTAGTLIRICVQSSEITCALSIKLAKMVNNNCTYQICDYIYASIYLVFIGQMHNTPLFTTAQCRLSVLIFGRCADDWVKAQESSMSTWEREREWWKMRGGGTQTTMPTIAPSAFAFSVKRERKARKSMARNQRWRHDVAPSALPLTLAVVLRLHIAISRRLSHSAALSIVCAHTLSLDLLSARSLQGLHSLIYSQHPKLLADAPFGWLGTPLSRNFLSHFNHSHNMHKQARDAALPHCRSLIRSAGTQTSTHPVTFSQHPKLALPLCCVALSHSFTRSVLVA